MEIKFTQSARKHRIGKARTMYVINHYSPTLIAGEEDGEDQQVWIGQDDRGLELEIVALVLTEYLLITHVMPTDLRRGKSKWPRK
jgi:hypothetical protein